MMVDVKRLGKIVYKANRTCCNISFSFGYANIFVLRNNKGINMDRYINYFG